MNNHTRDLNKDADELFNEKKYDDLIVLLTDEVLEKQKNAELYLRRGNAWYGIEDYDKAIKDYNQAIVIDPNYALAFYNRGLVRFANKEYDKSIEDYTKVIEYDPHYIDFCYVVRGNAWKAKGQYKKAIDDYTNAIKIKPDFETAYYCRGLARKEGKINLEESKQDFKKYLELTKGKDELSSVYAKKYIEELEIRINDKEFVIIADLVAKIKDVLLIRENCITHYTSLSTLKSLILDNSKFRISEGNCMNDPSEGNEFFKFLKSNIPQEIAFLPKPFIGCFVTEDKYNDLNMWRFYGKENGMEAKGCAITLCRQDFINYTKNSISNEKNKDARPYDENDINFYQVAYVMQSNPIKFYIPDSNKSEELNKWMVELKRKKNSYRGDNINSLEKELNSIAFLFKNDAYKNENEVRLVVNGIGFSKKYNLDSGSLNVYIELASIKDIVTQITLGPKVDKVNEWAAVFYYSYNCDPPKIMISHLPYK